MSAAQIAFWHHAPDILHAPYMTALAEMLPDGAVVCAFADELSEERRAMGWKTPDLGKCRVVSLNRQGADDILRRIGRDTVHIFNTVLFSPEIGRWFDHFRAHHARVFLTSEWRDWRGPRGVLRRIDGFRHERLWRRELSGVFAMGRLGERWFKMCGYAPDKIFPFCYVVADHAAALPPVALPPDRANLVFVGALVERKRLDLALEALSRLQNRDWNFQVVGDGPERQKLETLTRDLGIADRIRFLGVLENRFGRAHIAGADLLLLPSREDGWGAVVNEALMAGTPALCSDGCGAADLIRSPALGSVFRCGSAAHLASCLDGFMRDLESHRRSRPAIREWAGCITGKSVADYLLRCIRWAAEPSQKKPQAPWRDAGAPELTVDA